MDSLRGAVRTLGIAHIRDIAISCGLLKVVSASRKVLDPIIFWQHSLACAILARKLARSVGFEGPEKAYLAGLMHDIGFIVNLVVFPEQTRAAMEKAQGEAVFMGKVEHSDLGFTHCQSGELLARRWNLSKERGGSHSLSPSRGSGGCEPRVGGNRFLGRPAQPCLETWSGLPRDSRPHGFLRGRLEHAVREMSLGRRDNLERLRQRFGSVRRRNPQSGQSHLQKRLATEVPSPRSRPPMFASPWAQTRALHARCRPGAAVRSSAPDL